MSCLEVSGGVESCRGAVGCCSGPRRIVKCQREVWVGWSRIRWMWVGVSRIRRSRVGLGGG